MAEIVQHHDFIEVDYTGKLKDGSVFDTTEEEIAKKNGLYSPKMNYSPAIVCVGERQILPGLDDALAGKEVGMRYTVSLPPEKAFGKRDIKKMRIVPMSTFREHKVDPQPGLQIDVDGEMGTVIRVAGGRVIVNFNHPLAGKEIIYEVVLKRKITDPQEQLVSFLNTTMKIPTQQIDVKIAGKKAMVKIPLSLPTEFSAAIGKKLAELVKLDEVTLQSPAEEKTA